MLISGDQASNLDTQQREWAYCGLDAGVTRALADELLPKLAERPAATLLYAFDRALLPIAFAMQLRGFRVDTKARDALVKELLVDGRKLKAEADKEAVSLVNHPFKWAEALPPPPLQLMALLYDELGLKPVRNKADKRTGDKDALVKLAKRSPKVRGLCVVVQKLRDLEKQIEVLEAGLSADGRLRSMFNPGQAETDRWTSNTDPYGQGTNLMNIDPRIRKVVVPDPGYEFMEVDLAQAESRITAYLADDQGYIDAHEAGNTHVMCARMFWPALDIPADDAAAKTFLKEKAVPWVIQTTPDEPAKSYYDVSKNRQHGFNYGRTARSVAIMEGIKVAEGQRCLDTHFGSFPGIPRWHEREKEMLRTSGVQVNPLGFTRQFYGPAKDPHTIKEALANSPQSACSQIACIGMWRVWTELDDNENFMLLQHNYDSFVAQVRIGMRDHYEPLVREMMKVPVRIGKRTMTIPCEIVWKERWS